VLKLDDRDARAVAGLADPGDVRDVLLGVVDGKEPVDAVDNDVDDDESTSRFP
jgi:hypothetical protein